MKYATVSLSIIFIALAIFGSFGVHEAISHSVSCVGSLAQNASCPEDAGFAFISFHLDGLRSFSTGVAVAALALGLLLALFSVNGLALAGFGAPQSYSFGRVCFVPQNLQTFRAWFSLLERRDPAAA